MNYSSPKIIEDSIRTTFSVGTAEEVRQLLELEGDPDFEFRHLITKVRRETEDRQVFVTTTLQ